MNTKLILVAATSLLVSSCSMFSDEEVESVVKHPYAHPDFSVPKPSPYRKIYNTEKRIQHIFVFEFDSSELPENIIANIQPHVDYLISNPTRKVSIQGTADNAGDKQYNYALGEKRAKNIASLIVKLGVDQSQVVITSIGEERSLYVPNKSVVLSY